MLLRRGWIRAVLAASVMAVLPPAVRAQQNIVLANPVHSAQVRVTVGKTEDIRTDQNFANITVGDPDIADVSPLTDHSLSILGKKIGTTRVTVYDADHKPVGIFDVEVSYDISRLAAEIGHFTGGGIKVSSINGRILLSGTSPDAATLDKAVQIAGQFGPDPINTVQVMQPQQIELEVRFIEVDRNAGRDLGVQWNAFGNSVLANTGSGLPASQLPITQPNGSFQQPAIAGTGVGGPNVTASALPISPVVAAGVLSGAAPFGFLVGQLTNKLQVEVNALESKGAARLLAEPNLVTLSGETASFLAGGQIPIPEVGATGTPSFGFQPYGVGLSFTPTVLRDGVINLIVKPEVSEIDTRMPSPSPALRCRRSPPAKPRPRWNCATVKASCSAACCRATAPTISISCRGSATCRCSALCSAATDYQKQRDRPRHPGDAAHRAAADAGRPGAYAVRQFAAAERRRSVPDGRHRSQPGAGAARHRRAEPALCRPHPRPAEKRRRLCHGQRLSQGLRAARHAPRG